MRKHFLISVLLLASIALRAQHGHPPKLTGGKLADSLIKESNSARWSKLDTGRVTLLMDIAFATADNNALEAIAYGEKSVALAEKLKWKAGLPKIYNSIAFVYTNNNDSANTMLYSNKALTAAIERGDKTQVAKSYYLMGRISFRHTHHEKALAYFLKAKEIDESIGNKEDAATCLLAIGYLYNNESKYSLALTYYQDALKIYKQIGDHSEAARTNTFMADTYMITSEYAKAEACLLEALKDAEGGSSSNRITISMSLGDLYYNKTDYPKALIYAFKALKMEEAENENLYLPDIYRTIANVYKETNELTKALEYYLKALKLNEANEEQTLVAITVADIAGVYFEQKNFPKAIEYYKRILKTDHKYWYDIVGESTLNRISSMYGNQKKYAPALAYATKALELTKGDDRKIFEESALCNLGFIYLSMAEDNAVVPNSINKNDLLLDDYDLIAVKVPADKKARLRIAIDYLNKALTTAKAVSDIDIVKSCYEYLARAYKLSGDYQHAYESYQNFIATRDSVFSKENDKKMLQASIQYDYDKKYLADSLRAKDKEHINKLQLQRQQSFAIGGVVGVLLLLLVVGVLLRTYVVQKRSNKLKEELLGQKDMLMKEIHHRVKNNLQVISSLLDLQLENISDSNAQKAMNEGMSRIKSISLIHQQLYQNEDISTIEFSKFAKDLLHQVTYVFKKTGQHVVLTNEIPEDYLDIDTAVPLGLILNELMTNSYKYAFGNNTNGAVHISLEHTKGYYKLVYSDNGPGLPADYNIRKGGSMGLMVINSLSKELGGHFSYEPEGNKFIVLFKDSEERKKQA